MRRKIFMWLGVILLVGILGYFLGAAVVVVALIALGIGYWIARRRGGGRKQKDIVIRLRRW